MIMGLVWMVKPVWARNPLPPGVNYFKHVFVPAIQSQDVNLQSTVYEIYLSLIQATGESFYRCDDQCQARMVSNPLPYADSGNADTLAKEDRPSGLLIELMAFNTSFLSKPPVSSVDYIAHVGEKLHLVKPAYAQAGAVGFGYEGLRPAREIWTAFRNIAYLLATIGFVVLSFLIMFRIKISAQTVIGAQQAIVKLVVVFLAITFSYAIAGLIVDLLFLFSFVIVTMFVSTGLVPGPPTTLQANLFKGNIFQQMGQLLGVADSAAVFLHNIISGMITDRFQGVLGDVVGFLSGWTGAGIGFVIIGIAVAYALIKLLFSLLFAYIEILILTILAPLMILPDILPGGGSFMNWARRMFANAMVFPATTFMLLLGMAIVGDGHTSSFQQGLRLPYLGIPQEAVQPFLGVGIIMLTSKVVDMVKNALKVSAFQYTTAIGAALGAGAAGAGLMATPVTYPAGQAVQMGRAGLRAYSRDLTGQVLGRVPVVGNLIKKGGKTLSQQEQLQKQLEQMYGGSSQSTTTK